MSDRIAVGDEVGGLAERLLPHLDSAYNLARWLVHNGEDAEDVVQDAYVRALQYADLLVVRTLGVTFSDGAIVLPERVSRYVAEIVSVDAPARDESAAGAT